MLEKDAIDFINAWEKLESGRAEKEEKVWECAENALKIDPEAAFFFN